MRFFVISSLSLLISAASLAVAMDSDGDGFPDSEDCRPFDRALWAAPGDPVADVLLSRAGNTAVLTWNRPADLGGTIGSDRYGVFGSEEPGTFGHATGYCVELESADLTAEDPRLPAPRDAKFYLVRAENDCGVGPIESPPVPMEPRGLRYLRVENNADDGPGSLRQQIATASDGDVICLDVAGTIGLTGAPLVVAKNVTVAGPGADVLTLDHLGGLAATIELRESAVLSDVTVTNSTGGPTRRSVDLAGGTPTLRSSTITGSFVGVDTGGTSRIRDSLITGNNVGIYVYDTATAVISTSTISGNGIGVYSRYDGWAAIVSSTISGNTDQQVRLYYYGGAYVFNSTVSDGPTGIYVGGFSYFSLSSSTIADTDVALHVDFSYADVRRSILAGDTSCIDDSSTLSDGFNLATDTSCTFLTMPTDRQNTDPLLGPLADNGGPTETHALLPSSPAIDAGTCPNLELDQRGLSRPVDVPSIRNADDACDIGAYEKQ